MQYVNTFIIILTSLLWFLHNPFSFLFICVFSPLPQINQWTMNRGVGCNLWSSNWMQIIRLITSVPVCVCARVLNESSSFHPNPRSFCFSSSSASQAALVSWDSSLTDRQADGSDVGDISGIQQKQSRWKSMATMTVGSGEVGGGKWVERKELQLSKVQCKIEMSPTNNSNGPMSPTQRYSLCASSQPGVLQC